MHPRCIFQKTVLLKPATRMRRGGQTVASVLARRRDNHRTAVSPLLTPLCHGSACHSLTVLSKDPDAIHFPSGNHFTDSTKLMCPFSVFVHLPVCAFHTRTEPSEDPDAICFASGDQSTDRTASLCPVNVFVFLPLWGSHTLTVPSHEPDATHRPSGDQLTDHTHFL